MWLSGIFLSSLTDLAFNPNRVLLFLSIFFKLRHITFIKSFKIDKINDMFSLDLACENGETIERPTKPVGYWIKKLSKTSSGIRDTLCNKAQVMFVSLKDKTLTRLLYIFEIFGPCHSSTDFVSKLFSKTVLNWRVSGEFHASSHVSATILPFLQGVLRATLFHETSGSNHLFQLKALAE